MADFNFVTSRLATGAAVQSEKDVVDLATAGVTLVIDCRAEFDDAPLLATPPSPMAYLWNGTEDDGQRKPPEWFGTSITAALEHLAQPHRKVYVHCAAGVNRGPSACYAIMRAQGLTSTLAESLIRTARPQVGLAYKGDADSAIPLLGYS